MRAIAKLLIILLVFVFVTGCSTLSTKESDSNLPVVLTQDEILRPYTQLGRIQITKNVYMTDHDLKSNLQEWGLRALQEEAKKLGADALMLPDISSRELTLFIFPGLTVYEWRATGVAIKFK
jgi:hypothetical protein